MNRTITVWPLTLFVLLASYAAGQPSIISSSPLANQRNAAPTSPVSITFDQTLNPTSISALKIYSSQQGGLRSSHSGRTIVDGNSLRFTPSTYNWKAGENVYVSVTKQVIGADNQIINRPQVTQFTVATQGKGPRRFVRNTLQASVNSACKGMAVGDLNNDGHLDIITKGFYTKQLEVFLNKGNAAGSGAVSFSVGPKLESLISMEDIALGDIDGDGDLDAVCAGIDNPAVAFIYLNGGDASGSATAVFKHSQTAEVVSQRSNSFAREVSLVDVDADGDLDILMRLDSRMVSIQLNGGDATGSNTGIFTGTHTAPILGLSKDLATGDLDGDGDIDFVTATAIDTYTSTSIIQSGVVQIGLNSGDGTFTSVSDIETDIKLCGIALGDVDNDRDLDIVVVGYRTSGYFTVNLGVIQVLLNGGDASGSNTGVFSKKSEFITEQLLNDKLELGDIDGDGDLDIVANEVGQTTPDYADNHIYTILNGGDGSGANAGIFSSVTTYSTSANPYEFSLADIDGDGDLDIVTASFTSYPFFPNGSRIDVLINSAAVTTANQSSNIQSTAFISPNPAHDQITLHLPNFVPSGSLAYVKIYNGLGQLMYSPQAKLINLSNSINLTLPVFAPGIYYTRTEVEGRIYSSPIVIE